MSKEIYKRNEVLPGIDTYTECPQACSIADKPRSHSEIMKRNLLLNGFQFLRSGKHSGRIGKINQYRPKSFNAHRGREREVKERSVLK